MNLDKNELIDNKYFKWYWNICERAENRILPENTYIEKHHIFPVSIFGKNKEIVKLTAKEHYMVHLCLWLGLREKFGIEDIKTIKMNYAFTLINSKCSKKQSYDSKLYSNLTLAYRERGHTEESKKKMSLSGKGRRKSDITKSRMSIAQLNYFKNLSNEEKDNFKLRMTGENNGMFDKKLSKESIEKANIKRKIWLENGGKEIISKNLKETWKNYSIEEYENICKKFRGSNNGNFNKGFKKIWIEKYGLEEANRKLEEFKNKVSKNSEKRSKPIYVYDENFNLLNSFSSTKETAINLNISVFRIRKFLKNKKTCNNLYFMHEKIKESEVSHAS